MRCLADGPTPSQPNFTTDQTLDFVLCQIETRVRLLMALLLLMSANCWVPLPLCCPTAAPFLGAVSLSLEILISGC